MEEEIPWPDRQDPILSTNERARETKTSTTNESIQRELLLQNGLFVCSCE